MILVMTELKKANQKNGDVIERSDHSVDNHHQLDLYTAV